jgi:nitrite reductase (NADH) large subunit
VVIGGGLLGLETARGLQSQGVAVELVHAGGHLMNQQLDPQAGDVLRRSVVALGIGVRLSARTAAVLGPDRVRGVRLADGGEIGCDMVVVAAGVRPNSELGLVSGFTVERAIVVDDQMRVLDDPDVYAVGECAQHRARCTAWWRRCGSRPSRWRTMSPPRTRPPPTTAPGRRPS